MNERCIAAPAESGLRARWRRHRATRAHGTVRLQRAVTWVRLYRPMMRTLHRLGQCYLTTVPGPDGYRRVCTWCGNSHRRHDAAAAEASLRKAASGNS